MHFVGISFHYKIGHILLVDNVHQLTGIQQLQVSTINSVKIIDFVSDYYTTHAALQCSMFFITAVHN
jgi:hypothetical protein